jgi:hypothetical protein
MSILLIPKWSTQFDRIVNFGQVFYSWMTERLTLILPSTCTGFVSYMTRIFVRLL